MGRVEPVMRIFRYWIERTVNGVLEQHRLAVLPAADGTVEITVPEGWTRVEDQHEYVDID
jgi:hypothetical protein